MENEFEIRSYTQLTGSGEKSGSKLVAVLKFGGYASSGAMLLDGKFQQTGSFEQVFNTKDKQVESFYDYTFVA